MMMTRRAGVRLAGLALATALMATAAACGDKTTTDGSAGGDPSSSASESASPTEESPSTTATSPSSADSPSADSPSADPSESSRTKSDKYDKVAGTWKSTDGEWVLHLKANRRFVTDYQGIEKFLVGKYRIHGKKFVLKGDDGNKTKGTYNGKKIRLGDYLLKRKK